MPPKSPLSSTSKRTQILAWTWIFAYSIPVLQYSFRGVLLQTPFVWNRQRLTTMLSHFPFRGSNHKWTLSTSRQTFSIPLLDSYSHSLSWLFHTFFCLKDPAQLSYSSFMADILPSLLTGRTEAIRKEYAHFPTSNDGILPASVLNILTPFLLQFLYLCIEFYTLPLFKIVLPKTPISPALSVFTLTSQSLSLS